MPQIDIVKIFKIVLIDHIFLKLRETYPKELHQSATYGGNGFQAPAAEMKTKITGNLYSFWDNAKFP